MRRKLSWIELVVIVSIFGVLPGLFLPALLSSVGDFDREHRYPPPASRRARGLSGVAGEYYLCKGVLFVRVTEVSAVGVAQFVRARVNLGAKDALREGDVLTVQRNGPPHVRRLLVVSIADHSCLADEGLPGTSEHPLEPGMAVVVVKTKARDGPP